MYVVYCQILYKSVNIEILFENVNISIDLEHAL